MSSSQDAAAEPLTQAQIRAERNIRWVYWWLFGSVLVGSLFVIGLRLFATSKQGCPSLDDPAWSPDGGQIAFACSGDIYIANVDSGSRWINLTNNKGHRSDRNPVWSPDGREIAFWAFDSVNMVNADGSNLKNLTKDVHRRTGPPVWSPNGHQIAFSSMTGIHDDIYVIGSDGIGLQNLTNGFGNCSEPAWSPNGEQIAFVSKHPDNTAEIDTMNVDGNGMTQLIDGLGLLSRLTWSPDGRHLAFDNIYGISVINIDGSGLRTVGDGEHPAWSPDGQQIAFTSNLSLGSKIWVVNADGSGLKQLARMPGEAFQPRWSPNGMRIAFNSDRSCGIFCEGNDAIYVMDADGAHLRDIRPPLFSGYPWAFLFVLPLGLVVGLRSPYLYARRQAQQALVLMVLSTLPMAGLVWLSHSENMFAWFLIGGWAIVQGLLCLLGTNWGLRQIKRGDCWLMRRRGEGSVLPRFRGVQPPPVPDTHEPQAVRPHKTKAKIILIVCSVIWVLLFLPSLVLAFLSIFMSDALGGGAFHDLLIDFTMISALSLPILLVLSLVASWILYFTKNYAAAIGVSLAPILNIGVYVLSGSILNTIGM